MFLPKDVAGVSMRLCTQHTNKGLGVLRIRNHNVNLEVGFAHSRSTDPLRMQDLHACIAATAATDGVRYVAGDLNVKHREDGSVISSAEKQGLLFLPAPSVNEHDGIDNHSNVHFHTRTYLYDVLIAREDDVQNGAMARIAPMHVEELLYSWWCDIVGDDPEDQATFQGAKEAMSEADATASLPENGVLRRSIWDW